MVDISFDSEVTLFVDLHRGERNKIKSLLHFRSINLFTRKSVVNCDTWREFVL